MTLRRGVVGRDRRPGPRDRGARVRRHRRRRPTAAACRARTPSCGCATPADSVDQTLALIKSGHAKEALTTAQDGYLSQFELVEIPLRIADNTLTIDTESKFAEIRAADPRRRAGRARSASKIVELRGMLDDAERTLTERRRRCAVAHRRPVVPHPVPRGLRGRAAAVGPARLPRGGQEPKLLRPILGGVGLAGGRHRAHGALMPVLFSLLPIGREVLEAITALIAVAILFYVSFWLIPRLEHKRWMEFVRARLWRAISIGSTASLIAVGFTAVYREGFETALFYQSLSQLRRRDSARAILRRASPSPSSPSPASRCSCSSSAGKLPVKTFMNIAVVLVMATSVALIGNAFYTLQAADVITVHAAPAARTCRSSWREATGDLADDAVARRPGRRWSRVYVRRRRSYAFVHPASRRRSHAPPAQARRSARARLMGVRVGVDVGGTFTKAVAVDVGDRAPSSRPAWCPPRTTTPSGVAAGVVRAVAELADRGRRRRDRARHALHHRRP